MNRLRDFLHGIYGFDGLSCGLLFLSIVINLITALMPSGLAWMLNIISYIPIILCLFRVFSHNHYKRRLENQKFMNLLQPVFEYFEHRSEAKEQAKIFKFFKCPACGQKIRVPKGKGKIEITCPKCGDKFIKKT